MVRKILVVDDEQIIRESLSYVLSKEDYQVDEADNGKEAYEKVLETTYDLVITDLEMPEMKGTELLYKIRNLSVQTATIVVTAFGSLETAISALRSGANDYILKPIEFDELLIKVKRLFEIKDLLIENQILRNELQRSTEDLKIIGKSRAIKKIFNLIRSVADTESTVLITGKSSFLVSEQFAFNQVIRNSSAIDNNKGFIFSF